MDRFAEFKVGAIVFCREMFQSPVTGEISLVGCFSVLRARAFPHIQPKMAVYVAIEGNLSHSVLTLHVISPHGDATLIGEMELEGVSMIEGTMGSHLNNLPFPEEGVYYFQVRRGGKMMQERIMNVVREAPSYGEGNPRLD